MTDDVVHLGKVKRDGMMFTPEQTLRECIADLGKRGAFEKGKKLIVLCLDDTDECYRVSFQQCGMRMSECVTLCEIGKTLFKEEMEY